MHLVLLSPPSILKFLIHSPFFPPYNLYSPHPSGYGASKRVTTLKDVDINCQTLNPNGAFFKVTILTDQCTRQESDYKDRQ